MFVKLLPLLPQNTGVAHQRYESTNSDLVLCTGEVVQDTSCPFLKPPINFGF